MSDQAILNDINEILSESRHQKSLVELYNQKKEQLGVSDKQIADVLNIQYKTLMRILDKEAQKIDYVTLYKLSRFLKLHIEELGRIYISEDPDTISEIDRVRRNTYIIENFDLKTLKRIGLIDSISDLREVENRIINFFRLDKITDYESLATGVLFSKTKRTPHEKMRAFWVKSAHALFKKIDNPNDFDRQSLVELLPKIRPYTQNVSKGFLIVAQALFNVGVTVIFQKYLDNTQVRGGTFVVDGKPCIVITDYNKYYPTIWFALLHELHHVLYDIETIEKHKFHLTGEPDLFLLEEDKANEFARELLFSKEKSKHIAPLIHNHLMVSKFAKENQVHQSIVYAFYQFDEHSEGNSFWGAFRKYFPDPKEAVGQLNLVPWEKESIDESVEDLKLTLTQFT